MADKMALVAAKTIANEEDKTWFDTFQGRIAAIEGVNIAQDGDIAGLKARMTAAEGVNSTQDGEIDGLDSRVTALENGNGGVDLTGLEQRVTDAENNISSASQSIDDLQAYNAIQDGRLDTLEAGGGTADLDTRLTDAETMLRSIDEGVTLTNANAIRGKTVPLPGVEDDEKLLAYDNDTNSFKFVTPATGGGSGGTVSETSSTFTATGGETSIPIGVTGFNKDTNLLEVYQDNIRLFKNDSWVFNANGTSIDLQGYTATAGSVFTFLVTSGYVVNAPAAKNDVYIGVTQAPYNAVGDGVTDDRAAIQAALDAAKLVNGTVIFPYGKTFIVSSALVPYEGITLIGYGATLKHPPNVPNWTRILDATKTGLMYSGDVDSKPLVIKGLTFDGDYPNQGAFTAYEKEQCMLVILGADSTKAGRLRAIVEDCLFKNSTSDGLHIEKNVDILVSNCFTSNCWRGGIVASGGYSKIKVMNCHVGGDVYTRGIDMEIDGKGYGNTYRTDIMIDNLECDGTFDIGLQDGAWGYFSNIVQHKPNFSYDAGGTSHGRFINCRFVRQGTSTGAPVMYSPGDTEFLNCEFVAYKDPANVATVTYAAINLSFNFTNSSGKYYTNQKPRFKNCRFIAENKAAGDTFYAVATSYEDPVANNNVATFEDCYASADFNRFIHLAQGGNIAIHNLTCDGTQVVNLNYLNTERFYLKVSGYVRGAFTEYIRVGRNFDVADTIEHVNVYMDASKNVIPSASSSFPTSVTTIGNRVILGDTKPGVNVPGFVGDKYRLKTPVKNATFEWVSSSNNKTGAIWVISQVLGAIEGTPATPTGLASYSLLDTSFGLKWTANTDTITGYNLYVNGTIYASNITATSYYLKDLTANTVYNIELAAVESRGIESNKATLSVTTPAALTYIVSDNFNRADNTTLGNAVTGQTWTYVGTEAWNINGNTAYINAGTGVNRAYIDTLQADNLFIQVQVPTHYNSTRILFRKTTASNEWTFGTNSSNFYVLQKLVGGGATTIYTSTQKGVNGDVLRVELRGSEVKAFVNGTLLTTQTDTFNQTGTIHGLLVQTNNGVRNFDNFAIGAL